MESSEAHDIVHYFYELQNCDTTREALVEMENLSLSCMSSPRNLTKKELLYVWNSVFTIANMSTCRDYMKGFIKVIKSLSQSEASGGNTLKAVSSILERLSSQNVSAKTCLLYLRFTTIALLSSKEVLDKSINDSLIVNFNKLLQSQIHNTLLVKQSYKMLDSLLVKYPSFVESFVLTSFNDPIACSVLLSYILEHFGEQRLNEWKPLLRDSYIKNILTSKIAIEGKITYSFSKYLQSITKEEFNTYFSAEISKQFKRQGDILVTTLTIMLDHVALDMGEFIESFTSGIVNQLKSTTEGNTEKALVLISSLCPSINDSKNLQKLIDSIGDALKGVPPNPSSREALIKSLKIIATTCKLSNEGKENVLNAIVNILLVTLEKEKTPGPRRETLNTIGFCISLSSSFDNEKFYKAMEKGVKETDDIVACDFLCCTSLSCKCETVANKISANEVISKKVSLVLKKSAGKPRVISQDGYAAACVAFTSNNTNNSAFKEWNDGNSFLYPSAIIRSKSLTSISERDAISHLLFALASGFFLLKENVPSSHPAAQSLISLSCHPLREVRDEATFHISHILKENVSLLFLFVNSFKYFVKDVSLSFKDPSSYIPTAKLLRECLLTILPLSCSTNCLPLALLLSHHPLLLDCEIGNDEVSKHSVKVVDIKKKKNLSWFWLHQVSKKFLSAHASLKSEDNNINKVLVTHSENITNLLLGDEGLGAGNKFSRVNAANVISYLVSVNENETRDIVYLYIMPILYERLSLKYANDLSNQDIEIYFTPSRVIYKTVVVSDEYVPVVVVDKNKRKARKKGGKAFGGDDDSEDEEDIKRRKEEDMIKKEREERGGFTKEEEDLLASQGVIRDKVKQIVFSFTNILDAISIIVKSNVKEFDLQVPDTLRVLFPLLSHRLFSEHTRLTIQDICQSAMSPIKEISFELSRALQLIHSETVSKLVFKYTALFSRIMNVVDALVASHRNVTVATLHILVNVIKVYILAEPTHTSIDNALNLIAANTNFGSNKNALQYRLLRSTMLSLCLTALEKNPLSESKPDSIILDICDGPSLTGKEMAPLLGDQGVLSPLPHVRSCSLKCLGFITNPSSNPLLVNRIYLLTFDSEEDNKEDASEMYKEFNLALPVSSIASLLPLLSHKEDCIRQMAALATANTLSLFPTSSKDIIDRLINLFAVSAPVDFIGGNAGARVSILNTIQVMCKSFDWSIEEINVLLPFIITKGLRDNDNQARLFAMEAGINLINVTCTNNIENMEILNLIFQLHMKDTPTSDLEIVSLDYQREGLIVFLGALAKHMNSNDIKIIATLQTLFSALTTPSESVQRAVASCISSLIKSPVCKDNVESYVNDMLKALVGGTKDEYGHRRGAAYGLAGIVKGLGISSLKSFGILDKLQSFATNKESAESREGALLAMETLFDALKLLFEPYILLLLPTLLQLFSDKSIEVRLAAQSTSRTLMSRLSAHGVKILMPKVLLGLENSKWRTKEASIQMLGAMAYCAPKQLSSCLPQIVPRLVEVFGDTSRQVQEAGREALNDIGKVIKNPEISKLVPILLAALTDPSEKTVTALKALTSTAFVHAFDAPSLALIIPILHRGIREKSASTKKQAAVIVGNMCSLIASPNDIIPYIDILVPELQKIVIDPLPDVRSVTAKALGRLVRGMGESNFSSFIEWLVETSKSDLGTVERSGAAQSLAEIAGSLGAAKGASLLQQILPGINHPRSNTREGVMWLLVYLPPSLGKNFTVHISLCLAHVIRGLSDDNDQVRDVAMRAGSVIVSQFANTNSDALLPTLIKGVYDENWRIRHCSVQLLGDLLYSLSGTRPQVSEKDIEVSQDDDNLLETSDIISTISNSLGQDAANNVYACIYMLRSDNSSVVRQQAVLIWKTLIGNTTRILREIMSSLMPAIINFLASNNNDMRIIAGRCLGDIVQKLGERILHEIVPILSKTMHSSERNMRQGACLGLCEVISSGTKRSLEGFSNELMQAVQTALSDESSEVRGAAAKAFDTLQRTLGQDAVDNVVPSLLAELSCGDDMRVNRALDGLRGILDLRAAQLLPFLLPKLINPPMEIYHARALQVVALSTGANIHFSISKILPALVNAMCGNGEENVNKDLDNAVTSATDNCLIAIGDNGIPTLLEQLNLFFASTDVNIRVQACKLVESFIAKSKANYVPYLSNFLEPLVIAWNDKEALLQKAGLSALSVLLSVVKNEVLVYELDFLRNSISNLASRIRFRKDALMIDGEFCLYGLCLPRAIEPFLGLYHHCLMSGTSEIRRTAAQGLGELVTLSSRAALQAAVLIKLAGPMIRLLSQNLDNDVKISLLECLGIVINKGGAGVKPLVSQLQTTFVRLLQSNHHTVRNISGNLLGKLMPLAVRVDPLVQELVNSIKDVTDIEISLSLMDALFKILKNAGDKVKNSKMVNEFILEMALNNNGDEKIIQKTSNIYGITFTSLSDEESSVVFLSLLSQPFPSLSEERKVGVIKCIASILHYASHTIIFEQIEKLTSVISQGLVDSKDLVRLASIDALGRLITLQHKHSFSSSMSVSPSMLVSLLGDSNNEIKKMAVNIVKRIAKTSHTVILDNLKVFADPIVSILKDGNVSVKILCERALVHIFQIHRESSVDLISAYSDKTDKETSEYLKNYVRRVLLKQGENSGDESE